MLSWIVRAGVVLLAVLALIIGAGLGYRAMRQAQNAEMLRIRGPNGIQEAGYVKIGGIEQWVQIRGEDQGNPVLLVLHGGPGFSLIPFVYEGVRPWEKSFTIVQWDQRGAGRTYMRNGRKKQSPYTLDQVTNDGIELAEYLRQRLHKQKIVIVGISWGTMVGTNMARQRPDLFYAYVGAGQVVDGVRMEEIGYKRLMERVSAAGDKKAIKTLEGIGPPPYKPAMNIVVERGVLSSFPPASEKDLTSRMLTALLFAPGYSLRDDYDVMSAQSVDEALIHQINTYDAPAAGLAFDVPMIFMQGDEDIQSPTELVKSFYEQIQAPKKEYVSIEHGGHAAIAVYSDRFLKEFDERVRPLALEPAR